MKNLIAVIGVLFCTGAMAAGPDDILGMWLNANGKGQIEIYKQGNQYFGRLTWMKEPNDANGNPRLDSKNPDPALQHKPLLGAILLRNVTYDKGEWIGGRVYDPQNGKDYRCIIRLKDARTLSLRGYIGISLLGRTEVWTRVK